MPNNADISDNNHTSNNDKPPDNDKTSEKANQQWHRLAGLILEPLFKELGYETNVEVDVSLKRQIVDLIAVKKEVGKLTSSNLDPIFWQAFDDFNEHNLISFKSYSESFTAKFLFELYGHLINYEKVNNVSIDRINLYVITYHYPRDILKPFEKIPRC